MAKYCADCEFINPKDAKGKGAYKCKKCKRYVASSCSACEKFQECYHRNHYDKQKLYDSSTNETPLLLYVVVFILLCILYVFGKIMGC